MNDDGWEGLRRTLEEDRLNGRIEHDPVHASVMKYLADNYDYLLSSVGPEDPFTVCPVCLTASWENNCDADKDFSPLNNCLNVRCELDGAIIKGLRADD